MKLLWSTENKITKDKKIPHLESAEVVLVYCNIVNNDYQQDSRNHIILKTFNSEFQTIEVWFTDQNSQLFETEDRIDLTLVIK